MSYADKPVPQPYAPPGPAMPGVQPATNPLGTLSLVLSLLSLVLGCPLAIAGMITGWIGMQREPSGIARAGFIVGLVMTILNVVGIVLSLILMVFVFGIAGAAAYADKQARTAEPPPFAMPETVPPPWTTETSDAPAFPEMTEGPYVPPFAPPGYDPAGLGEPPGYVPPNFGPGGPPPGLMPPPGMGFPVPMEAPVGPGGAPFADPSLPQEGASAPSAPDRKLDPDDLRGEREP